MAHHKLLCLLSYRSFNLIIMEVAQRLGQKVSFESCLKEWKTLEKDFEQCQNKHKEYRKTAELYNSQRMNCKTSVDRQIKKMKSLKNALKK